MADVSTVVPKVAAARVKARALHCLSPLLFGLYFDRVVEFIKLNAHTEDAIYVPHLAILAALYADNVILRAPSPSSL